MTTLVLEHLQHADSASPDITIDSSGRVGIGTTSPDCALDVTRTSGWAEMHLDGASGGDLILKDNGVNYGEVYAGNGHGMVLKSYANQHMSFLTDANATAKMTILANGNVGIGTASPSELLHVAGKVNISNGLAIGPAVSSTYTEDSTLSSYATNNGVYLNGHANGWLRLNGSGANRASVDVWGENYAAPYGDSITFRTGGTADRMMVAASGNVGIGTTSPTAKLSVDQPSTTAISLTGGAAAGQIFTNEDFELAFGLSSAAPYPLYIQGRTSNPGISTPRNITLNPLGGNISIGTQSAIDKFNVETSSTQTHSTTLTKGTNTPGAWITNSNNDNNMSGLHLATGSGTHFSSIVGARTANASHWGTHLAFYTHDHNTSNLNTATEKMRISGDGYVTTPNQPGFRAYSTVGNISTGAIVQYNIQDWGNGSHYSTGANRFTAPVSGKYAIHFSVKGINIGATYARIKKNGTHYGPALEFDNDISSAHTCMSFIGSMNVNDYIEVWAGSNVKVDTADSFSVILIG